MGSIARYAAATLVAAALGGCGSANDRVARIGFGSVEGLATTGALRIVTDRKRLGYPNVVCTEPSPDYVVAFKRDTNLNLNLTAAGVPAAEAAGTPTPGAKGEADAELKRDEVISKGDGRTAAVVALRDGLYAACQSYANGVIGQDAYAVILSQYGHLLVALVGAGRTETGEGANAKSVIEAARFDTRRTTLSTLIVACLSGHDPTRLGVNARPNQLLGPRFCQAVLNASLAQATGRTKT